MITRLIILSLIIHQSLSQLGYDYYTEWLTGLDKTVNGEEKYTKPKFPLQVYTRIQFPRRFSRRPQVLLMHEEIEWNKNRNVDYQTYVSDVSINGFYLNYIINGPAIIPKMSVRWVAFLDSEAEVLYVNYCYEDLINLRSGFGTRHQDFLLEYYLKFPTPRVAPFIIGAEIEVFDSHTTTIQVQMGRPSGSAIPIRFLTRDYCHINAIRMAFFITSDYSTIVGTIGASDNHFNQFLDNRDKTKLRVQKFEREVPVIFNFDTPKNVLSQGITGFDVHARAGNFYLKVGGEYVDTKLCLYKCSYGTKGDTILQYLQVSYILHGPAPPPYALISNDKKKKDNGGNSTNTNDSSTSDSGNSTDTSGAAESAGGSSDNSTDSSGSQNETQSYYYLF